MGKIENKIVQIKVMDCNEDMIRFLRVLHKLYKEFLLFDQDWHYFYEGSYSFLRVNEQNANKVIKWIDSHTDYLTSEPEPWIEPWPLTRRLQDCFQLVFHANSVLVMEMFTRLTPIGTHRITNAADRVIHSFLNMATYLGALARVDISANWEGKIMGEMAIDRSFIWGQISGEGRMKRIYENIESDKKGKDGTQ